MSLSALPDILKELDHPLVRQLAWCLGSPQFTTSGNDALNFPPVGHSMHELLFEELHPILLELDNDPSRLLEALSPEMDRVLGIRFEALITFAIQQLDSCSLIARNIQVVHEHVTLTEFDVFFEWNGSLHHWELAIKYYLGTADRTQPENWIGPRSKDRLSRKFETLNRQYALTQEARVLEILKESQIADFSSSCFVKGMLFHKHTANERIVPNGLNDQFEQGKWCHSNEMQHVLDRQLFWAVVPKAHWAGPIKAAPGSLDIVRKPEIVKQYSGSQDPLMLCGMQKEDGWFIERERWMVVSDGWPALTPTPPSEH